MKKTFLHKTIYGAGESVSVTGITVIGLYFLYFLTDVVGLTPALAGSIFMIGRAWDAISDPIVGYVSDQTKTKWGRRRPYFMAASFPLLVLFLFLWYPVGFTTQWSLFLYYSLIYVLFMTSLTLFHVPYISLITEYSTDYDERTSINNYRIFFQLFVGLMAATIPKLIADQYGYQQMGLYVGFFIAIVAIFIFTFTRENRIIQKKRQKTIFKELKSVFQNRPMRYLLWIYVGSYAAANIIESFVIYYMKYYLNREIDMPILFVVVIGTGILTLPLWAVISKQIGKRHTLLIGLFLWIFGQVGWLVISPSSAPFVVYVIGVIVGAGYGVAHVLPWAMLPDVVDVDEWETGEKREGIYAGIMTFFMKMANSIAIFFIGIILELSGYIANTTQSETTLRTIKWTMAIAPGMFIIVAIIATFLYPFTKEKHMEIRSQLEQN
ncbi:MFS transporter [Fervidibacillus halotolerans]|uniref:Glycoside-pentoside-hexuronide (GPH):cation symporter n=1 Tax=Fervidibacillus halotolerans TaxID=2980027 RepID=A0A9E8LZW7_9BACI|nr:glycoside-pentoside-hexuronide (GPH):cation symporter [Fervidibacillus halotolerans]WAA12893.1 glycoside-pentoside-hexuronide (GPH):cation symporter [Fervidibacillus halotolerans]